jgi:spore coat protein H
VRRLIVTLCLLLIAFAASSIAGASRPSGWDDATHGRDAVPDYDRVFAADRVNRLDITVSASDWSAAMADMTAMAGPFGAERQPQTQGGGFGGLPTPSAEATAACSGKTLGDSCSLAGVTNGRCTQQPNGAALACVGVAGPVPPLQGVPGGGNAGGGRDQGADDVDIFPRTPMYVPADVVFDGHTFTKVGFRFKGNSSLSNAWRAGNEKLPLRLNADVLDDQFPEIRDQTVFGFPNLSLTNNGTDTSFLRHRVVTDLFREAGVPAARTAFVRVFLNRGSGPVYLGLYTITEVPDSPMLNSVFGSDDGNLYKPVGTGGRWTQFFQLSYPKKTNAEDEDWTDIQDAIAVLNEPKVSAAAWRARLEARLSVSGFLRWLALNTIVGNFDAYGGLSAHNYYLYGSPRHRDRLYWIPWDHDLAMNSGGIGGAGGNPGGGNPGGGIPGGGNPGGGNTGSSGAALDLFLNSTGANWPLIRFLLDDPIYRAEYRSHVEELITTVFDAGRLTARLRAEERLIAPYVVGPEGEQSGRTFLSSPAQFSTAVADLVSFVESRSAAVKQALGTTR